MSHENVGKNIEIVKVFTTHCMRIIKNKIKNRKEWGSSKQRPYVGKGHISVAWKVFYCP